MPLPKMPAPNDGDCLHDAVIAGLSAPRRRLPCRFFYDEAGSALFERICDLEEYYPTRTERSILHSNADAIIAAAGTHCLTLIELGSGSSAKTRLLLDAALRRQLALAYIPIDISSAFLAESADALRAEYPRLHVAPIAAEYRAALCALPAPEEDGARLFIFLGGNIGNFEWGEAASLLASLRCRMRPQDRLLVGMDRVKETAVLTAAYNDRAGVTAAFNKNLLARINRELGADFDLAGWEHDAPFRADLGRIEMWLVSTRDQTVRVGDRRFIFHAGERIHTENSHKYTPASFGDLARTAGLCVEQAWSDPRDWFTVSLLRSAATAGSA